MTSLPTSPGQYPHEVTTSLCGLNLSLRFQEPDLSRTAERLLSEFQWGDAAKGDPDCTLLFSYRDGTSLSGLKRSEVDVEYDKESDRFRIRHVDARFDVSASPSERVTIEIQPTEIAVENAIRLFLSVTLPQHSAYMVHAASIQLGRSSGVLFPGESGAGKTTLSRKFGFERTLSDELSCVRARKNNPPLLYGTPFLGDMEKNGVTGSRIAAGILFLEGNTGRKEIQDVSQGEAIQRLYSCLFSMRSSTEAAHGTLRDFKDILDQLPAGVLHYSPDEDLKQVEERIRTFVET